MYENYKRLRDKKGLKDSDISRITGIAKSTLSDWKNGKSIPKINKLACIADVLDVSLNELTDIPSPNAISYDEESNSWESSEEYYINEEAKKIAEFLHKNQDYKVLFDATQKVKPEDLKKAIKAIGIFID